MSKLRSLSTAFWSDPFIEDLSPNHKLLFIHLITNDKTNMLGIYEASVKKIAFETGIKKEDVLKGLEAFEKSSKVKYVDNYVFLINYMKHQNYNTNMKKSAIDIYNSLPNNLKDSGLSVSKNNPSKGFETLLKHFGMVSKVEVELEDESEDESEKELYNQEVFDCYEKCLQHFPDTLRPRTDSIKLSWLDTIDKLNRIDKLPFDFIYEIVEKARSDSFWMNNFMSVTKLRMKNKEQIPYFVVFYEKLINNENNINGNKKGVSGAELREVFTDFFTKE
jgi:hypothetical protein